MIPKATHLYVGLKCRKLRSVTMEIKVLGPGCPKCRQTEKVVKETVEVTIEEHPW